MHFRRRRADLRLRISVVVPEEEAVREDLLVLESDDQVVSEGLRNMSRAGLASSREGL